MTAEPIEKEFDIYTPSEMYTEAQLLNKVLAVRGWNKLMERYLKFKKVVNLNSRFEIRAVVDDRQQDYIKYRAIFDAFRRANCK